MSVVARLEKALEFLKANEWGQVADRRQDPQSGEFAYCARGAIVYGAFSDLKDHVWCDVLAQWHEGSCVENDGWTCGNEQTMYVKEFDAVLDALDQQIIDMTGWRQLLTAYNDDMDRTKEDMVDLFEAAIAKAKEDEAK